MHQDALHQVSADAEPVRSSASSSGGVTIRYVIEDGEPPSHALVTVLAALAGSDPAEIRPLGRYVDLEALDELLAGAPDSTPWKPSVRITFRDYVLTVDDREIVGTRQAEEPRSTGGREGPFEW